MGDHVSTVPEARIAKETGRLRSLGWVATELATALPAESTQLIVDCVPPVRGQPAEPTKQFQSV